MLHAGKYQVLFFQNRRNQTICYISDIIFSIGKEIPGNPGYYQVHIGLYISVIPDAIIRAQQLPEELKIYFPRRGRDHAIVICELSHRSPY